MEHVKVEQRRSQIPLAFGKREKPESSRPQLQDHVVVAAGTRTKTAVARENSDAD